MGSLQGEGDGVPSRAKPPHGHLSGGHQVGITVDGSGEQVGTKSGIAMGSALGTKMGASLQAGLRLASWGRGLGFCNEGVELASRPPPRTVSLPLILQWQLPPPHS